MSRYYGISIIVKDCNPNKYDSIKTAASGLWPFNESWTAFEGELSGYGEDCICYGEDEKDLAKRLAQAVFEANGSLCVIQVDASFLAEPPTETFRFGEREYRQFSRECLRKGVLT